MHQMTIDKNTSESVEEIITWAKLLINSAWNKDDFEKLFRDKLNKLLKSEREKVAGNIHDFTRSESGKSGREEILNYIKIKYLLDESTDE